MIPLWIIIWLVCSVSAYFLMEATVLCCDRREWDRDMREIDLVLSLILGPIFLIIALELLILAEVGKGMEASKHHSYRT